MDTKKENLRKSSYMIPIKLEDGKYMLLHGYTGAIDVVSKEILKDIVSFPSTKNIDSELLTVLVKRGYITVKTSEEEHTYASKVAQILHRRNELMIKKNFTILVTYNCNFKCPYCFEKEIVEKQFQNQGITISENMVDKIFDCILKLETNQHLRNQTIQLFGGEPLLKENKPIVEYIVKRGKQLGFTFVATSNGYDLDYYDDLFRDNYIHGVQVTIDGTKSIHDLRRVHSVYNSSFDKIISNIEHLLTMGIAIRIRINVDSQNIGELLSLNDYFEEKGFYSSDKFSVYAEYISGSCNFNPSEYEYSQKENLSRSEFLKVVDKMGDKIKFDFHLYTNIYSAIHDKKSLNLSSLHCTAQSGSYIFDPMGNIYSCLEVVGNKQEVIGSYLNNEIAWTKNKEKWFNRDTSLLTKCSSCKYALLCGGGCFAKVGSLSGESYCDDFPLRLKRVVQKIYSRLSDAN